MENTLGRMQLKYLDMVMKAMFHTGKFCTIVSSYYRTPVHRLVANSWGASWGDHGEL